MGEQSVADLPCTNVPSPDEIKARLFPHGNVPCPRLPTIWNARALLVPPGGTQVGLAPRDELFAASLTYDASTPDTQFLRAKLYALESLAYIDLLFRTTSAGSEVWLLSSRPDVENDVPDAAFGPIPVKTKVPNVNGLAQFGFNHAGTWQVLGRARDAFSGRKAASPGTWFWFDSGSNRIGRIMNVAQSNDIGIPVLGSFYIIDFPRFSVEESSNIQAIFAKCANAQPTQIQTDCVTLADLLVLFANVPQQLAKKCSLADIQGLLPGFKPGSTAQTVPSWSNQVTSECFMIGQDLYPYYCQVWYDWTAGAQLTVFVQQDAGGNYNQRFDELLPKGKVGPAIVYNWNGASWDLACCQAGQSVVPMPVPNFVQVGHGKCRANFLNDPYYGNTSFWSVVLGGGGGSTADFWYTFDEQQRGVIFSLSPAGSLTIIDYQTFVRGAAIPACMFVDPSAQVPSCNAAQLVADVQSTSWAHRIF